MEQRVLDLIGQGCSDSEVAEQLGIPIELLRGHLRAINEKLGAGSTTEALIVAIRRGLIRLPPR